MTQVDRQRILGQSIFDIAAQAAANLRKIRQVFLLPASVATLLGDDRNQVGRSSKVLPSWLATCQPRQKEAPPVKSVLDGGAKWEGFSKVPDHTGRKVTLAHADTLGNNRGKA